MADVIVPGGGRRYGRIGAPSRAIPILPGGVATTPAVPSGPNTVTLDPYLFPPPNATTFNIAANTAVAGAGVIFTPPALQTSIPGNCFGVISTIDLLLDSILITTVVNWFLLINGVPVPGYSPLTILGRNGAASVSRSWAGPLRILVPLGGSISWLIQDVDGGNYTAGTAFYGWFWPQER